MDEGCSLACVRSLCNQDFIERNGTWVLSIIAMFAACIGGVLTYFLKSRCRTIRCCGVMCERKVLELEGAAAVQINTTNAA